MIGMMYVLRRRMRIYDGDDGGGDDSQGATELPAGTIY